MSWILRLLILILVLRALWRLYLGIRQGLRGQSSGTRGSVGVALSRDPVCGTYVVPGRALALRDGGLVRYFCSERCRDAFAREPRDAP
jgi:YHS domain-containing protein